MEYCPSSDDDCEREATSAEEDKVERIMRMALVSAQERAAQASAAAARGKACGAPPVKRRRVTVSQPTEVRRPCFTARLARLLPAPLARVKHNWHRPHGQHGPRVPLLFGNDLSWRKPLALRRLMSFQWSCSCGRAKC